MKKILFALFVLTTLTASFGQTILNSHSINLRGSRNNHQILNAVNLQKEVFSFASDKEKLTALKYNEALFFKDSLSLNRPDKEYEFIAGYSFENNGNPRVYWASKDFKKVKSIMFDFDSNTFKIDDFQFAFTDESILNIFSENNFFYILTLPKAKDQLKIYALRKGEVYIRLVDFSANKFLDEKDKTVSFNELIRNNGLEMIDNKSLNPLFQCVGKSKMYVDGIKMILTFDNSNRTQVFEIDLNTFATVEKIIPQQILVKSGKSNSYYLKDKLYTLETNEAELSIAAVDLKTEEVIKKYYADMKDTISFRNSPLFSQTGNQKGRILKNTKKFLQRLEASDVGISVYRTPNELMVTVGGVRSVTSTGSIIMGFTAGAALIASGSGGDIGGLFSDEELQSTYFEALFNDKFEHQSIAQRALAADAISQFLNENDVELQSVFTFKEHYILSYYDPKKQEFIMRKFEDAAE